MMAYPRISVITTGGLIDSIGEDRLDMLVSGPKEQWLDSEQLLAAIPELFDIADVKSVTFDRIGADLVSTDDWVAIHCRVTEEAASGVDGIVVALDTSILEEVAYFLHLSLKVTCPVVAVGAMRPASAIGSDARLNLLNAVRVAASPGAGGRGVLVAMNSEIHESRSVLKMSTSALQAFQSLTDGPLGRVDPDGRVVFSRISCYPHTVATPFKIDAKTSLPRVDIVLSYYASQSTQIDALVAAGTVRGIVSAGTSITLSQTEKDALDRAVATGIAVVQASRVAGGNVLVGSQLDNRGIVAANGHSPWKARVLLMLGLTQAVDANELQKFFVQY